MCRFFYKCAIMFAIPTFMLAGAVGGAVPSYGPLAAAGGADLARLARHRVAGLVQNYSLIKTVHFVAVSKGHMSVTPQMRRYSKSGVMEKRYEFLGKGKLYRINFAFAHPNAFASEDFVAAFNGHEYQYMDSLTKALSIDKYRPSRKTMLPEPLNPMLMPLVFLTRQPVSPKNKPISFREATGRPRFVLSKAGSLVAKSLDGHGLLATIAGGSLRGKRLKYHVFFKRSAPVFLPRLIDLVGASGEQFISYRFMRYKAFRLHNSKVWLPQIFQTDYHGPHGALVATEKTVITYRVLNKSLRPNAFTINYKLANAIYDGTHGSLVQMRPGDVAKGKTFPVRH